MLTWYGDITNKDIIVVQKVERPPGDYSKVVDLCQTAWCKWMPEQGLSDFNFLSPLYFSKYLYLLRSLHQRIGVMPTLWISAKPQTRKILTLSSWHIDQQQPSSRLRRTRETVHYGKVIDLYQTAWCTLLPEQGLCHIIPSHTYPSKLFYLPSSLHERAVAMRTLTIYANGQTTNILTLSSWRMDNKHPSSGLRIN